MINSFLNFYMILSLPQVLRMKIVDQGNLILENNQSYYSLNKENLIVESDKSNITEVNWIGYDLIHEAFSISNFQEGKLVKVIFLNSFHFTNEFAHCICQLLKSNNSYYIVCIDGVFIKKGNEELKRQQYSKTYKISLMLDQTYECDGMFQDIRNHIIVFCSNSNSFQLSIINILNQTITTLTSRDFQFQDNCEIKFINELNAQYLLIYKCLNWMILEVKNFSYQILLNDNILKIHRIDIEIDIVNQIQFCFSLSQKNVYLASRNWYRQIKIEIRTLFKQLYYVFELNDENILLRSSHFYQVDKITLLIFVNCQISAIVSEVEQQDFFLFKAVSKEILIKKDYYQECYSTSQYILLRHNNQLMIILSEQFKYTLIIQPSKIEIINTISDQEFIVALPQLFYQIDLQKSKAYFNELDKYKFIIKPQKKYLYIFSQYNYFSSSENLEIFCFKVLFINNKFYQNQKQFSPYEHKIYNKCQMQESLFISKLSQYIPSQIGDYQINKNKNNFPSAPAHFENYNIQEEEFFFIIYDNLKIYNINQIIWISNENQPLFQNMIFTTFSNKLYCLDSNFQVLYKKEINQEQIFHQNGNLVFVEQNSNFIEVVLSSIYYTLSNLVKLNDQIIQVNQFPSFLILQLKNQQIAIYDFNMNKIMYLNQNLKQFGMPIFYMKSKFNLIIQYQNLLIYSNNQQRYYIFPFENIQIIDVEIQISYIKIKTIHTQLNYLKTFYLNKDQLLEENDEYYLQNFTFSNTRQMIFSSKILILGGFYFNQKSLHIIFYDNYIKTLKIKFTNKFQFSYINGKLYYYNLNNELMIYNVKVLNLTINNLMNKNQYQDKYQLELSAQYVYNQTIFTITKELQLVFLNYCYKIYSMKNLIYSNEFVNLSLRDIYIGPIDQLTINDNNSSIIKIPFNFLSKIQYCTFQDDKNCIQIYNFTDFDFFKLECLIDDKSKFISCESYLTDPTYFQIRQFIQYENQSIVYLIQINQDYYFKRFKIDKAQLQIVELFQVNLNDFDLYGANFLKIEFKNKNNLIQISQPNKEKKVNITHFYYLNNNNTILNISYDDYFNNICSINNAQEWYLLQQSFKYENELKIYKFQIIIIEFNEIKLKYEFKIDHQVMQFFIEKNLIESYYSWNDFQQLFFESQKYK